MPKPPSFGFLWPKDEEVVDERHPAGNREYSDLRGFGWGDARAIYDLECSLISKIQFGADEEVLVDEMHA